RKSSPDKSSLQAFAKPFYEFVRTRYPPPPLTTALQRFGLCASQEKLFIRRFRDCEKVSAFNPSAPTCRGATPGPLNAREINHYGLCRRDRFPMLGVVVPVLFVWSMRNYADIQLR